MTLAVQTMVRNRVYFFQTITIWIIFSCGIQWYAHLKPVLNISNRKFVFTPHAGHFYFRWTHAQTYILIYFTSNFNSAANVFSHFTYFLYFMLPYGVWIFDFIFSSTIMLRDCIFSYLTSALLCFCNLTVFVIMVNHPLIGVF